MTPTTRDQFKQYCLRKLGSPVVEVNLDSDQIDDRVDEALNFYVDFNFSGVEKIYYKYQVTDVDKANRYITVPDNVVGVVNIFPIGTYSDANGIFNLRYQFYLNDLYTFTSSTILPYYMTMTSLQNLEQILVGQQPIRYNRRNNILYIDTAWATINTGDFIVAEAYQVLDPNVYTKIWSDRWLQNYATCLMKENWGANLIKFRDMKLPNGLSFNGEKIYNDAVLERKQLEKDCIMNYSMPPMDMIG